TGSLSGDRITVSRSSCRKARAVVALAPLFTWVQATGVAKAVADSVMLTAGLSAIHLIGFTLLMGSALVSNLRLAGVLFQQRPIVEVHDPANRAIALGLIVSIFTGLLLFAARASAASANGFFQLKMGLLVA